MTEWMGPLSGLTPAARNEYHRAGTTVLMPESNGPLAPNGLETTVELLAQVRQGDRDALDRLIARCLPPLRRWARGRLPSAARGAPIRRTWSRKRCSPPFVGSRSSSPGTRRAAGVPPGGGAQPHPRRRAKVSTPARRATAGGDADRAVATRHRDGRKRIERYEKALKRSGRPIVTRSSPGSSCSTTRGSGTALGKPNANAARMAVTRALARLMESAMSHERDDTRRCSNRSPTATTSTGTRSRREADTESNAGATAT